MLVVKIMTLDNWTNQDLQREVAQMGNKKKLFLSIFIVVIIIIVYAVFVNVCISPLIKNKSSFLAAGIYLSAILSSLVFGIMHLMNLIWSPSLIISTMCLVIYATFAGFLFCVIYYRSKNLISCMLLHGIFDFTAYFWFAFSDNLFQKTLDSNSVDISIGNGVLLILLSSTFVISGMVQLRKEFNK